MLSPSRSVTARTPVTWEELSKHTSATDLWLAINGHAYDLSNWVSQHPGGSLVLLHHAGRDATDAFTAYHPAAVHRQLQAFSRGPMQTSQKQPVTAGQQEHRRLLAQLEAEGAFVTDIQYYARLAACLAALLGLVVALVGQGWLVPGAVLLALFWQQVAFIGHDAGHRGIFHDRRKDALVGLAVNSFVGIGISWWKATHDVHHVVVNSVDCDPDIQFMPFLAISREFFRPLWSRYHGALLVCDARARALIGHQHLTFLPLLMVAKFGLYIQAFKQLTGGRCYISRPAEACAQLFFFAWYAGLVSLLPGAGQRFAFVMLSHAAFFLLHLQICLSHFSRPTFLGLPDEQLDWMQVQVAGTMNWSCPPWLDWLHGGLQFQVEHHLFPRLPRHALRAAAGRVRPLCARLGLPYHCVPFWQALRETLATLYSAALEARKLGTAPPTAFSLSLVWEAVTTAG